MNSYSPDTLDFFTAFKSAAKVPGAMLMFMALLFSMALSGCTYPKLEAGQEITRPVILLGSKNATADLDLMPSYKVMPDDILDLLYHFDIGTGREFKLLPQDVIQVKFPNIPELNQEQGILPDGRISLPYIGEVMAKEMTPAQLEKHLKKLYSRHLKNPDIHIVVAQYGGKIAELKRTISNAPRGQSKLLRVRTDGYCSFPVVGDLKVAGKSIPDIAKQLNEMYHKVTEDVRVDLILYESAGSKVSVMGSVNSPGFFTISRPISVVEAISLAGGHTNQASLTKVVAMHREKNKILYRVVDVDKILSGDADGEHVFISVNDIVFVPRSKLSTAAQIMREIADVILFNGWGINASYDMTPIVNDRVLNVSPLKPVQDDYYRNRDPAGTQESQFLLNYRLLQ